VQKVRFFDSYEGRKCLKGRARELGEEELETGAIRGQTGSILFGARGPVEKKGALTSSERLAGRGTSWVRPRERDTLELGRGAARNGEEGNRHIANPKRKINC